MENLFEYRREMDSLRFSDEEKARLIGELAVSRPTARRRPVKRMVLVAAALTAVLVVGAGATGVLKNAVEVFSPLLGGSVAQTEVIDKIGRPIDAGDTDNGVTISADAIIGDRYNACIVYTIRRDDGTPLLPEGVTANQLLMGGTGGADLNVFCGTHGSSWFVDEDPADNKIQMIQTISADRSLNNCTATAEFDGLRRWDDEAGQAVSLIDGHWKFRFDVDFEDASVSLGGGETFEQGGMTFTITDVLVSPVAVRVEYEVDSAAAWIDAPSGQISDEDRRTQERYFEQVEILLTKADGTVMDLSSSGGSIRPKVEKTRCIKGEVLDQVIPLEEMESLSVGGIVFPIQNNG
ncbi:DUF4179 domain-containing protein [Oscillibacter sp. MSJ-2]|uniref:DUF4179 domain-containing protein n=1 Tax=Dysosmobacter acutus TaxID=2841504 RepID=A0ABS6F8M1_9FIRM|nr:DUF4179 domain-containing protein [Dysosmobacter acutus]MBU5626633.1 DUF4179 domain-containing protein [Dysosmobacter acutus]